MKLHLPKMLRAALVAALALVAYPGQAAITEWDISQWNGYNQDTQTVTVGGSNVITQSFDESVWNNLHGSFVVSVDGSTLSEGLTFVSLTAKNANGASQGSIEAMSLGSNQLQANTWTSNVGANIDLDTLKGYDNLTFVLTRGNDNKMSVAVYDSSSDFTTALATTTHNTAQSFSNWKFSGVTIGGVAAPNNSHAANNDSVGSFTVTKAGYSLSGVATAQDLLQYYSAGYTPETLTWNGTAESHTWDTVSTIWTPEGAKFHMTDNVIFGTGDMSKEVTVNSNITAGAVTVSDEYTFQGEGGVSANTLSITETGTLNLNTTLALSSQSDLSVLSKVTVGENGTLKVAANTTRNTINLNSGSSGTLELTSGNISYKSVIGTADATLKLDNGTKLYFDDGTGHSFDHNLALGGDAGIEVYGTNYHPQGVTITGDVSGSGYKLTKYDGGQLSFTGQVVLGTLELNSNSLVILNGSTSQIGSLYGKSGSVSIGDGSHNATVTVNRVEVADAQSGNSRLNVAKGAVLNVTGSNNGSNYKQASLLLGEWDISTTSEIAGTLVAANAQALIGDKGTNITITNGGTMAVKGIAIADTSNGKASKSQTLELTVGDGGKLVLGSAGIVHNKTNNIQLNAGEVGISADSVTIAPTMVLNSATGTTFNTAQYTVGTDGSVTAGEQGGTLTISGALSGDGKLVKAGEGTLVLNGDSSYTGGTTINAGDVVVGHNNALGTGDVTLSGGTLTVGADYSIDNTVNMSSGTLTVGGTIATVNATGGTVDIAETGNVNSINVNGDTEISGTQDATKLGIAAGKTATMDQGIALDGITISGAEGKNVTVSNTAESGSITYSADNTDAKVTAASLTADSDSTVTVGNKLVVDSVTNEGSGELKLTGSVTASEIAATSGAITLMNQGQSPVEVSTLTIGAEKAVGIYTGADTQTEGAIKVTGNLTSAAGSDLYANLVIGNGATLDLTGALTLHSTITVDGSFTVDGTVGADIAGLEEGATLTFIKGDNLSYTGESLNGVDAYGIVSNVQAAGQYLMVANGTTFGIQKTGDSPIPEPTTGTLSLLALAGLMARRRRK